MRVAHQLEVEGYDVQGLVRRGDVYVADVVAQGATANGWSSTPARPA